MEEIFENHTPIERADDLGPLIKGEGYLHCTWGPDGEAEAKKAAKVWGGTIKPFGVNIKRVDPRTNVVMDWEKTEGYSVWVERSSDEGLN